MNVEDFKVGGIFIYSESGMQTVVRIKQVIDMGPNEKRGYPDGWLKYRLECSPWLFSKFPPEFSVGITKGEGQHYCPWRMEKLFQ